MRWFARLPPWRLAVTVFLAAEALCSPWGNYPLNDDWLYARTAARLAGTGAIVVDEFAAAPGIVQAILAAPFIEVFGFSHTLLRLLTLAVAGAGLWCVDRLLRFAGCPDDVRLCALLTLALSPFWFYLSATFMTEIHGLVVMLLAAVVWFRGRSRADPQGPLVGLGAAVLAGTLAGVSFWNRQNGIVWLGALVAASALRLGLEGAWMRLRRSVPAFLACLAAGALMVLLYMTWARATGNLTPQFSRRLANLSSFDPQVWLIQSIVCAAYLTVFLAPLLVLARTHGDRARSAAWGAGLLAAACLGAWFIASQGGPEQGIHPWLRRYFPYLPNTLFNAGLGTVTFAEVVRQDYIPFPHWPLGAFRLVHVAALLAAGLWGLVLPRLGRFFREDRRAVEVFLFGAAGAALSFALTIQGSGRYVFDRYHLPGVLGGVLALGAFLGFDARSGAPARTAPWRRFVLPWLALSCFTVLALHDHFRWNDARWALVRDYLDAGGSSFRLQAGYEVNAWYNYDAIRRGERPMGEAGCCSCWQGTVLCVDDTFWVGMAPPMGPDYRVVRSIRPRYWLTPGQRPVSLYRR